MAVYLDYNASSPVSDEVLDVMVDAYKNYYGNIESRLHVFGQKSREITTLARDSILSILGLDTLRDRLVFTSGATESNNIAILGIENHALKCKKTHLITTAIEHKAVLEPMRHLQAKGFEVDFIEPDYSGRVSPEKVLELVTSKTALVSVMHVNSETGIIQPVKEIGDALKNEDVLFHIDATQSFGKLNQDIRKLNYDMMSFAAHKMRGPQGIGGLVVRKNTKYGIDFVHGIYHGGSQEYKLRPGTTPIALAVGFAKAAELANRDALAHQQKCAEIKQNLLEQIKSLKYVLNGEPNYCIPGTINISFCGVPADSMFTALKDLYAFSKGSACTVETREPSYVLKAMKLEPDPDRLREAIRLSWDHDTKVDFTALAEHIADQQ